MMQIGIGAAKGCCISWQSENRLICDARVMPQMNLALTSSVQLFCLPFSLLCFSRFSQSCGFSLFFPLLCHVGSFVSFYSRHRVLCLLLANYVAIFIKFLCFIISIYIPSSTARNREQASNRLGARGLFFFKIKIAANHRELGLRLNRGM